MNRKMDDRISRVEASVKTSKTRNDGCLALPVDEAREVARESAAAFADMVRQYQVHWKLSVQEAVARAEEKTPATIERILHAPPDQVSWFDIHTIAQLDPEAAQRRWEEIKEAAR